MNDSPSVRARMIRPLCRCGSSCWLISPVTAPTNSTRCCQKAVRSRSAEPIEWRRRRCGRSGRWIRTQSAWTRRSTGGAGRTWRALSNGRWVRIEAALAPSHQPERLGPGERAGLIERCGPCPVRVPGPGTSSDPGKPSGCSSTGGTDGSRIRWDRRSPARTPPLGSSALTSSSARRLSNTGFTGEPFGRFALGRVRRSPIPVGRQVDGGVGHVPPGGGASELAL